MCAACTSARRRFRAARGAATGACWRWATRRARCGCWRRRPPRAACTWSRARTTWVPAEPAEFSSPRYMPGAIVLTIFICEYCSYIAGTRHISPLPDGPYFICFNLSIHTGYFLRGVRKKDQEPNISNLAYCFCSTSIMFLFQLFYSSLFITIFLANAHAKNFGFNPLYL